MVKYSIYTENKNLNKTITLLSDTLPSGYTLNKTVGYWQGQKEKSIKIEILLVTPNTRKIKKLCDQIKTQNNQQSILLTTERIKTSFI